MTCLKIPSVDFFAVEVVVKLSVRRMRWRKKGTQARISRKSTFHTEFGDRIRRSTRQEVDLIDPDLTGEQTRVCRDVDSE